MRSAAEYLDVVRLRGLGTTYDEIARRRRVVLAEQRDLHATYAYLLGSYLGDGHILRMHNGVYKLSVYQDARYTALIAECVGALAAVSGRCAGTRQRDGCVAVYAYSKHWPCLFPQHGPGPKHKRPITLADWQRDIAETHPMELLRGLVHSDGCRAVNRVGGGRYEYPRYFFSNRSADIHAIFRDACDRLGIRWRQNNAYNTNVARRADVALLDSFIGPKA